MTRRRKKGEIPMAQRTDTEDASGFVMLSDHVPGIIQEIRYHSTFNFIGERIDGYEELWYFP